MALVYGRTEDGTGLNVLRKRQDRVEAGVLRPLEHGKPIDGDVVQLHQRGESPLFDVEVHVQAPQRRKPQKQVSAPELSKGPPQVASSDYRKGWDLIYRSKANAKKLLN